MKNIREVRVNIGEQNSFFGPISAVNSVETGLTQRGVKFHRFTFNHGDYKLHTGSAAIDQDRRRGDKIIFHEHGKPQYKKGKNLPSPVAGPVEEVISLPKDESGEKGILYVASHRG